MPEKMNFVLRAKARAALRGNWQIALLVGFISMLPGLVAQAAQMIAWQGNTFFNQLYIALTTLPTEMVTNPQFMLKLFSAQFGKAFLPANLLYLLSFLVTPMLTLGLLNFCQRLLRKDGIVTWKTAFSRASIWLKALGMEIMVGLKTFCWALPGLAATLLLIILSGAVDVNAQGATWLITLLIACYVGMIVPMVIAMFRYKLSQNYLAQHPDWKIMQCINASKQTMVHQKLNLFSLMLSFIGWGLIVTMLSNLVFSAFGQVIYMVVYMMLNLMLNVYMTCSICAFYDAWREPDPDPLKVEEQEAQVR